MNELKEVLMLATREAGKIIQAYFQGSFTIENKEGINNLVTEVDKRAEEKIIEIILRHFPSHSIISEETGEKLQDSPYQWIIDPIDGTVNFAHGIPICCVSIGLLHNNELVLGAVYNPMMNELFFAEKGQGATLNGVPISVSAKKDFRRACLVTGFPYKWPNTTEHPIKVFERFILEGLPVRRLGSAAIDLCWVACGRFDGFWEYNLSPWDVAAGYLIVQEAGGRVTNFAGNAFSVFDKETLATNGHIHDEMLRLILHKNGIEKTI
ncbi:inositol monophosphatase family protein [Polluticoccus soli]|uniref:inositol monophosphatase family protein n=1 Tax=Polluticoccus soli TaxID=3034150 RepID=UPI0023E1D1C8|nr:inositol monophosphatase family protein [Flavipsychrobacter sp. JY13-12]